MKIIFRNFFFFRKKNVSKIKFREEIIHYTISQNNYIFPHIALVSE